MGHFEIPREGLNWPDHRPLPLYVMRSCTDQPTICVLGFRQFANGSEDLTLKTQLVVKKILDLTPLGLRQKEKVLLIGDPYGWPFRSKIFGNDPTSILILDLLMMLQFDTVNEENLKNIPILVFARMETDAYFYLYVCGKRRR